MYACPKFIHSLIHVECSRDSWSSMAMSFLLLLLFLLLPHFADKAMHLSHACRILPSSPLRLSHTSPFQQSPSPFLQLPRRRSLNLLPLHEEKTKKKSDGHGKGLSISYSALIADSLLDLLGGKRQSESVDPSLSRLILPYLRFLVPPEVRKQGKSSSFVDSYQKRFQKRFQEISSRKKNKELLDQLINWPPSAIADLARKAVEWNGDKSVVLNSLSEATYLVPDVEGSNENHCQLTKYTYGHRFKQKELNAYFAFLFEAIAELAPSVGFNVSLNRFDLFHGHLFLAHDTGRLGILFHAREYPAFNEETFPVHLGYCQVGSPVTYDDSMNFRNILWLAPMPDCSSNGSREGRWLSSGSLIVLDAHPDGIIYRELVPEYVDVVRTIYEDEFGDVVVDLNYFSTSHDNPEDRLFIC